MPAPLLAFENIRLIQGSGALFDNLDVFIHERDRLALIGRNGAGKTTLLKLLAGAIEADSGRRSIVAGTRMILLEQEPSVEGFATLHDFACNGHDPAAVHEVEAIADQIGIDLSREAATASGGERRRAAIARALASNPDILLLDEPTNHLDITAIDWLENWLARYRGAFVAISHDRAFLTRLTKATLWLDRGQIRRADIGFGGYEAWLEKVQADEERTAQRIDARLKIEEHWLERGVTGRRKRNQGRLTKLIEMRAQRAAMTGMQGAAKMSLQTDDVRTKSVIAAAGVSVTFGNRTVIRDFDLKVQRGDRIGIVGANGAGKTTLLRLLTGDLAPTTGTVKLAQSLNAVIIDQQRSLMAPEKTVRDVLTQGGDWIEVDGGKKHIIGYLKDFLFDPGVVDAPIKSLSGGERSRLLLAREFTRPSNLLVLDEPTNDLDLETLDLLQDVIADYNGTVLIVSHDRDFLDRTVTVTLGLDGSGTIDVVIGGYGDWVAKRAADRTQARKGGTAAPPPSPKPSVKLTYKDQRDYDQLPAAIEAFEAAITRDEALLADATLYARDAARFAALTKAIEETRAKRTAAEERWLTLAERVDATTG